MNNNTVLRNEDRQDNLDNLLFSKLESPEKVSTSFLALFDQELSTEQLKNQLGIFNKEYNIFALYRTSEIRSVAEILEKIEQSNIKKITLFVTGESFSKAVELILLAPTLFRRAIFVDPIYNKKMNFKNKLINLIEKIVPFGLPFYLPRKEAVLLNNLIRLRCPTLFLNSPNKEENLKKYLLKVPNGKTFKLKFPFYTETGSINLEALKIIMDFLEQPVKRSQKPEKVKIDSPV